MQRKFIQHLRSVIVCGAVLAPLALAGCGGGETGPQLYPVKGEVTFAGAPVETGTITFRKAEGDSRAFSGDISNGQYQLEAEEGKMTVEIIASRPTGKFDDSNPGTDPVPIGEMYIPEKYNAKTELTADVAANADGNDIPFKLTE
jgi:hypothetical protein